MNPAEEGIKAARAEIPAEVGDIVRLPINDDGLFDDDRFRVKSIDRLDTENRDVDMLLLESVEPVTVLKPRFETEVELKGMAHLEDLEASMYSVQNAIEEAQGELSTEHTHIQVRLAVMMENAETIFKLIERAKG